MEKIFGNGGAYLKVILMIILLFCAVQDWKDNRIPNRYLIYGIIIRAVFVLFELFFYGIESLKSIIFKILLCLLIFIIGCLVRRVTKNGLGMGDIKLFCVMALYLSVGEWIKAIFYSCFLGMIFAFVLRFARKPTNKFPFAPAVFWGTFFVASFDFFY